MTYAEVQREIPTELQMPCRWCETPTSIAALAQYGGRCWRCYDGWTRKPQQPAVHEIANRVAGGPRAWAEHLRMREQRGERLSPFQRAAWREALGQPMESNP